MISLAIKNQRDTALDILRGVAILVVVLGHSIQANIMGGGDTSFIWSKIILAFQMPLLFFISGYSAGFSYPAKYSGVFIREKTMRLMVPYIVWENIHFVIVGFLNVDNRTLNGMAFVKEIFISDFWFLRTLFIFYLILWMCNVLLKLIKKLLVKSFHNSLCTLIVTLFSIALVYVLGRTYYIKESISVYYYLWFVAGWLSFQVKAYIESVRGQINLNYKLVSVLSLAGIVSVNILALYIQLSSKIVGALLVLLIIFFVVSIEKFLPKFISEFLKKIGENTLPIYAIHWCLLFSPLWRLGFYNWLFGAFPLWLSSIMTAVLWTVLCLVLIRLFEKSQITRKLLLGIR